MVATIMSAFSSLGLVILQMNVVHHCIDDYLQVFDFQVCSQATAACDGAADRQMMSLRDR